MKAFSPKVNHTAPQIDQFKAHIQNHQFLYGIAVGFVLAGVLARTVGAKQTVTITIPRTNY